MAGAFGRTMTLFGQCRGQIGRVFCDERRFSRFTECLLAALADSESVRDPLPLIDRDAAFAVRRRWALGLDEGATLILGGESAEDSSGRRLLPTVFTNVEERMSMARQVDPMPVLCLLRTPWKP